MTLVLWSLHVQEVAECEITANSIGQLSPEEATTYPIKGPFDSGVNLQGSKLCNHTCSTHALACRRLRPCVAFRCASFGLKLRDTYTT
eukprot:1303419-Amphidinium_carterae.1